MFQSTTTESTTTAFSAHILALLTLIDEGRSISITANGHTTTCAPSGGAGYWELDELQERVGGYIEVLTSIDGNTVLIINEEGKLLGLPMNLLATEIARARFGIADNDLIAGTALLAPDSALES